MGDRGTIAVSSRIEGDGKEAVFLYSHWGGSELPETLRMALSRSEERWCDQGYLSRVIFEEMIDEFGELTGFGITTRLDCTEYPIIVVRTDKKIVYSITEQEYEDDGIHIPDGCDPISINEYVVQARTWDNLLAPLGASS